ncbi:MAG: hypothetical protein HRT71_09860 [Flavobacteriales bacterium]|nr:hypothetical protein [Flavobacteriales bacterium]
MNIFLTQDYEIYFGEQHGTVDKCIIEPTNGLIEISKKHDIGMTYFVDVGFIIKLDQYRNVHPELDNDYQKIVNQLNKLENTGNECQLHIHPHWEDAIYEDGKWKINVDRYKLKDFDTEDVRRIVATYKSYLEQLVGHETNTYRAGGWCLQPFNQFAEVFKELGIKVDSTVFKGGVNLAENYYYDFREYPDKTRWNFEDDLCKEDKAGSFLEVPISNMTYSALFFWQLFIWGRVSPENHKSIGDGFPILVPGSRIKMLTSSTNNCVSSDGYFANSLSKALKIHENKGNDLVVIGHPKACTLYSLKKLEQFVAEHVNQHQFKLLSSVLND